MRILRLILAGVIAAAVLVAGFFAAAVLLLTGLVGYVMQFFRGQAGTVRPGRPAATNRERPLATGDVIDVEVTKVSTDSSGR